MLVPRTTSIWSIWLVEACGAPAVRSVFIEDRWPFDVGHWGWLSGGEALVWPKDRMGYSVFLRSSDVVLDSVSLFGYREIKGVD